MSSARICSHQRTSKRIQKHSKDTPTILQSMSKVRQMKPMNRHWFCFNFIHIKDLKEKLSHRFHWFSQIFYFLKPVAGAHGSVMQISKSGRRRKTASLYNGAKLRVWYKKNVSHRGHRGHREEITYCGVKSKRWWKFFYFFRNLVESTCAFGPKKAHHQASKTRRNFGRGICCLVK